MKPSCHWWAERMVALALVPLSVWFVLALLGHIGAPREDVATWLATPVNSILLGVLMLITLIHTKMGITVIIDDYVRAKNAHCAIMLVKNLIIYALMALTACALYKLHGSI